MMLHKLWPTKSKGLIKVATLATVCLYGSTAHAQSLPWEDPLCKFANALTGKTAFALAVMAFFGVSAGMIWGEELKGVMKTLAILVLVVSILVAGASMVRWLFPSVVAC